MESLASALGRTAWDLVLSLAPLAAFFAALALVMKRGSIAATLRHVRRETLTNIALVVLNYVVLATALAGASAWWDSNAAASSLLTGFWAGTHPILVFAVTLLIGEFIVYWRHRIEHLPLLWPMHAVHHSDESMTWLALLRKHPLGYLFSLFVDAAPLLLLGLPVWAILGCSLLRAWWGYFIHADLPWTLGPVGKWIFSPVGHRLHHIDDLELCGSNYGGILTLWDRLFGTWIDPAPYVNCRTGVDGGSRGFLGEVARPFEAWAGSRAVDAPQEPAEA